MTKSINTYRRNSTPPLLELYRLIAYSRSYRSLMFRSRAILNYHRFLAWGNGKRGHFMPGWRRWVGMIGYLYGRTESVLLTQRDSIIMFINS